MDWMLRIRTGFLTALVHSSGVFECNSCRKTFEAQHSLRQHQNSTGHCYCAYCDQYFNTKAEYTDHKKLSPAHKPRFSCSKCNRHFGDKTTTLLTNITKFMNQSRSLRNLDSKLHEEKRHWKHIASECALCRQLKLKGTSIAKRSAGPISPQQCCSITTEHKSR